MVGFIRILLTVFIILDCFILILLVLMQLPKKEAGAGLAFGGAATDALFGAGSGNLLTRATKYAAGIFFVLAIILSIVQNQQYRKPDTQFRRGVEVQQGKAPAATPTTTTPATAPPVATTPVSPGTNLNLLPVSPGTTAEATNR
jgi:preprotein translocase subunit SecG